MSYITDFATFSAAVLSVNSYLPVISAALCNEELNVLTANYQVLPETEKVVD